MSGQFSPRSWNQEAQTTWKNSQARQSHSSRNRSSAAHLIRQTSKEALDAQHTVKADLGTRLDDLKALKDQLEETRRTMYTEIGRLLAATDECKSWSDFTAERHKTNGKCLATRAKRPGIESVADSVESTLLDEEAALTRHAEQLAGMNADALDMARTLKACVRQIDEDLEDKADAERLDVHALTIGKASTSLGNFRDTMVHRPATAADPGTWKTFSMREMDQGQREVAQSQQLGVDIDATLDQIGQSIATHHDRVNQALTRRVQEYDSSMSTNSSRVGACRDEIRSQEQSLDDLQTHINAQVHPMALATTRLSTRARRPNVEFVVDAAHTSLVNEANLLDNVDQRLHTQVDSSKQSLMQLQDGLNDVLKNDQLKKIGKGLEEQCQFHRSIDTNRSPRKSDYHDPRSPGEWQSYGRTRAIKL